MVSAQNYRFLSYGLESGLCDRYVYTINQDTHGFLWLGTGVGVCRFDGTNFVSSFPGDSLPSVLVTQNFFDSKGRPWFGYADGSIAFFENQQAVVLGIEADFRSRIAGFGELSSGEILVATQDKGLLLITEDLTITNIVKGIEGQLVSAFSVTIEGTVLLGTFEGLSIYELSKDPRELKFVRKIDETDYSRILSIKKTSKTGNYLISAEGAGVFNLDAESPGLLPFRFKYSTSVTSFEDYSVLDLLEDSRGNLWVCTNGDGIFKVVYSEEDNAFTGVSNFGKKHGLNSEYIGSVFEDAEGNLWFGNTGLGNGLSVLRDQAFSFTNYESDRFNDNILSLLETGNEYWFGSESGILVENLTSGTRQLLDTRNGLPKDRITSLYEDRSGTIWAGTSLSGIYQVNKRSKSASRVFFSRNSLENMINAIDGNSDEVWVATNGGVLRFDLRTGSFRTLTTSDRLPHNKILDVFVDSRGKAWIATRSNGLYCVSDGEALKIDVQAEMEFVSITEDSNGKLWAVTSGAGVFEFAEDSLKYFSSADGLLSNYGYNIACDYSGNIWVGHRLGLSRINPISRNVKAYGIDQGFSTDLNYNAVITNNRKNLVFGTSRGIIEYDPKADIPDTLAPKLNITGLRVADRERDFTRPLYLPYSIYKIRIDFTGINFKSPETVKYQYRLKGYDDWSDPVTSLYAQFPRVGDGNYIFELKACDESGNCTETPLQFAISIKKPIWKTWWFIIGLILLIIGSVYFIIKFREKKQKELQEYLERELDERTREVMQQKEEIENKNRDITDSINYAQRIQASILPPIRRLNETFSGNFLFYQPRDIVSGDFYWYDRIWGNKFVIVCADSTGHGVPGAFMSMIGTTLIKDICSRGEVNSPAAILRTLDKEIRDALNQNLEAEKSNDGMDIIVAEIDLDSNYVRLASAMRPVILYTNGEQKYLKGSRSSVGGRFDDDGLEKEFLEEEFQLQKGDIIYMFSDGYPDQFGGPLGKKFKMVRLKNLLRDIHDKPMEEQYNYIKSNFLLWKEDLEQVDDVLFMGIKI
jgi:ligand-binding sensor domain-containing protein/serine phosphatase RsbU (regulator of sigma subunit)